MAKEDTKTINSDSTPPKKSKKMLFIIIAVVFFALLAGAGGAFYFINKKNHAALEEDTVAEENLGNLKKQKAPSTPVFIVLDTFVVNLLPGENGDQYLQLVLALELNDPSSEEKVKKMAPKIKNNVTLLLSSRKAQDLMSKEGKEELAQSLKDEINQIVMPMTKGKKIHIEEPVVSVLFNSFIIQ